MNEEKNTGKGEDIVEEDILKVYKGKDTKKNKEILKERFYHGSKKTKHQVPKKVKK
ncbi:MAG: hypothetical protein HY578_00520 [Nitrospinae bacterium]|jgi:hypothetical protein|nr:hypothetical protein [Nitrospinota bacterium]